MTGNKMDIEERYDYNGIGFRLKKKVPLGIPA